MSPLYTYNGKLLAVNGKLAINQNCCCAGCKVTDSIFCASLTLNSLTTKGWGCDDEAYANCIAAINDPENPSGDTVCDCVQQHCYFGSEDCLPLYNNNYPETIKSYWFYAKTDPNDPTKYILVGANDPEAVLFGPYNCHEGGRGPVGGCADTENLTDWFNFGCYGENGISIIDCYGCEVGSIGFTCGCVEGTNDPDFFCGPDNLSNWGCNWDLNQDEWLCFFPEGVGSPCTEMWSADINFSLTSLPPDNDTYTIIQGNPGNLGFDPWILDPYPCS